MNLIKSVLIFGVFTFFTNLILSQKFETFQENGKIGLKQDGKIILKPEFDEIPITEIRNSFVSVKLNGKWGIYNIGKNSNWHIPAKFDEISSHFFHYRIAFGSSYDIILDRNYQILDSMTRLEFIKQKIVEKEFVIDSEGNETSDYKTTITWVPTKEKYLKVGKIIKDLVLVAIYSLEEKKLISPWMEDINFNLEKTEFSFEDKENGYMRTELLVYGNGKKQGFYIKNITDGSDMEYELIKHFKSNLILKKPDSNYLLYKITHKGLELISDKYIFHPENNFLTFSFEGNKTGYLGEQGVNETSFDSIFLNRKSNSYFTTFKNGKYGLINPSNDLIISPISTKELYPSDSIYHSFLVSNEKKERFYVDFNSQKLFKCSRENVYPKKEGNFYYLFGKMNGEIGKFNEEVKQVENPFLLLELSSSYYSYFNALGTNKKMGIINFKGDTIFPFIYDEIDLMNYDGDVFHYISVQKGKKKFICDWRNKTIINIPFDEISPLSGSHENRLLFLVKNKGKLGLFNLADTTLVFQTEYDDIQSMYAIKNYGDFLIAQKKSTYEVYFYSFKNGNSKINTRNSQAYHFLFQDFGYIKVGEKYEEYDLYTHQKLRTITENEILWEVKGITIYFEKGKFGVRNSENEIIFPAIYDNLRFNTHYQNDLIFGYMDGKFIQLNSQSGLMR